MTVSILPIGPVTMTVALANEITGGLSNESKMPDKAWSIDAKHCITGGKLRKVKGSPCFECYAHKHAYTWPVVKAAMARRLEAWEHPLWVPAMAFLIARRDPFFRWFGSGDLQSLQMLTKIVSVVRHTPDTHHWLPTQEYDMVRLWLKTHGRWPCNLVVRLSGRRVDHRPPSITINRYKMATSTVVSDPDAATCRAHDTGNKCGPCRKCWDHDVPNVSYPLH